MKKVISVLTLASVLAGNMALAGNGDVGSVNSPLGFDSKKSIEKIYDQAGQIGGIDALSVVFDLAKGRNTSVPNLSKAELDNYLKERVKLEASIKAELKIIETNKSRDCFLAAAEMQGNVRGASFASTLRVVMDVVPKLFNSNEGMTVEHLRAGANTYADALSNAAHEACK